MRGGPPWGGSPPPFLLRLAHTNRETDVALGWGIVGPGGIADREMAPAIAADSNSELVAVVARDPDKGRAFAEKHGAGWSGTDYDEMLKRSDVDVVLITTPNGLHADQVVAAAGAGKHVLGDKPLALTAADAVSASGLSQRTCLPALAAATT